MVSTRVDELDGRADTIREWFLKNGGRINPAVEIAADASTGYYLRVRKGYHILADSSILSCPHSLTLSVLNMHQDEQQWPEKFKLRWEHAPEMGTRFFLMEQYLRREDSLWWPYIQMLPQPSEKESLRTPMWYEEDDCAWIHGTNLGGSRHTRETSWRKEYEEGIALLKRATSRATNLHSYDWTLYKWAATMLTSRCFPGSALASRQLPKDDFDACPVLIPVFDLANHNPSAKVTWEWGVSHCNFITDERIEGGEQIWNNYGPKGNEELIMGYGFSIFRNVADKFGLALSTSESSNFVAAKKVQEEMLGQQSSSSHVADDVVSGQDTGATDDHPIMIRRYEDGKAEPKAFDVTASSDLDRFQSPTSKLESPTDPNSPAINANDGLEMSKLQTKIFYLCLPDKAPFSACSQEMLDILSFMVANNRELLEARANPACLWIDADDSRMTHNKVRVACQLIMVLQLQYANITKYNIQLPAWPRNERQFHAARYRRSQVHILQTVITSLLGLLHDVVFKEGQSAVKLEDILLESPMLFIAPFRAAIHHCLRTRKPSKIRSSGQEHFVYTLWLCTLWLFYGNEGADFSTLSNSPFHNSIRDWILFLRIHYCPPPGWQHVHCVDVTCSLRWRNTTDNGSEGEDVAVANSYLEIVQAVALNSPKSLYSDSKWTVDFLRWGYNVVMQESFMYPSVDDTDGDAHDEFMLFVEKTAEP